MNHLHIDQAYGVSFLPQATQLQGCRSRRRYLSKGKQKEKRKKKQKKEAKEAKLWVGKLQQQQTRVVQEDRGETYSLETERACPSRIREFRSAVSACDVSVSAQLMINESTHEALLEGGIGPDAVGEGG